MDNFLWCTGVATWVFLGVIALLEFSDLIIDRVLKSVWTKKEFMAFVWERLKARR